MKKLSAKFAAVAAGGFLAVGAFAAPAMAGAFSGAPGQVDQPGYHKVAYGYGSGDRTRDRAHDHTGTGGQTRDRDRLHDGTGKAAFDRDQIRQGDHTRARDGSCRT